jgi:hypothetical protein
LAFSASDLALGLRALRESGESLLILSGIPNVFEGGDVSVTFEVISGVACFVGARRIQAQPKPSAKQMRAKGSLDFMCADRATPLADCVQKIACAV